MRPRVISVVFWLAAALLGASVVLAAESLPTVTRSAAGVTIKATPRALPGGWEFEIVFETHTQDLKDDPAKSATLIAGGKKFTATEWQGDSPGGHHRKGVLRFNTVDPQARQIELRLLRPGETDPRSFNWQLK